MAFNSRRIARAKNDPERRAELIYGSAGSDISPRAESITSDVLSAEVRARTHLREGERMREREGGRE